MAWTTPRTWVDQELVNAALLNTHLRDNLNYLLSNRPSSVIKRDNSASYSTTSTNWVDVDGTNLKIDLTISGSKVLVCFNGMIYEPGTLGLVAYLTITVDGVPYTGAGGYGLIAQSLSNNKTGVCLSCLVTGLTAGSHTFKLQWAVSASTAYLAAGNGIGGQDLVPAFWAVEVG